MKRLLSFNIVNDEYVVKENSSILFSINGNDLKFDSLKFYAGVYKGVERSTQIQIKNDLGDDPLRKGKYIFEWISDIINSIQVEFGETEITPSELNNISSFPKEIRLFDMSACAGDGFDLGNEDVQYTPYNVYNHEADYAVNISGKSMEPTISDGSIVLVKKVEELANGDIGIFNINGNAMCKRYTQVDGKTSLVPDNPSGFEPITNVPEDTEGFIQGKVIDVYKPTDI